MSPQEVQSQEQLNKLIESQRLGELAIQEKPIAMPFITGQQAALERRAGVLAEPLVSRLALLQAQRTGQQAGLEKQVGFAEAEMARVESARRFGIEQVAKKQPTYQEIDGQLVKIDPITGQATRIFGKPKVEKIEGVTLSPGEIRYEKDPITGELKQVAAGGPRQPTEKEIEKALEKTEKNEVAKITQAQTAGLINNILANPNLSKVSGISRLGISARLAVTAGVRSQLAQLKSLTALEGREKLKGTGAISDFEANMLATSANSLNFSIQDDGRVSMPDNEVRQNLLNIRGTLLLKAGQSVPAIVTDPETGRSVQTTLTSKEANDLFLDGNIIDFQ